uniref:Putative ovule protein n=1 Tax=Solanum chacoense TaxID=4108 RepID=A0A0V0GNY0_SOLCH
MLCFRRLIFGTSLHPRVHPISKFMCLISSRSNVRIHSQFTKQISSLIIEVILSITLSFFCSSSNIHPVVAAHLEDPKQYA